MVSSIEGDLALEVERTEGTGKRVNSTIEGRWYPGSIITKSMRRKMGGLIKLWEGDGTLSCKL